MSLEHDLKNALHRESPAPGFASRVLQRIEREEKPKRPFWGRGVAASLTLTALLGGYATYAVHERREGERAKEQLIQAMRIAGEKVHYAQQEVRDIGTEK
jgi:hypothetical protein